jgi:hypothetical protein
MLDSGSKNRQVLQKNGGASRDRTDDLIVANDALSQLSYSPMCGLKGWRARLFYQRSGILTKSIPLMWQWKTCTSAAPLRRRLQLGFVSACLIHATRKVRL